MLDGCDGEIARLKYQESALGCWIETFGDYSYYVAIFVGLTVGAVAPDRLARLLLARRDRAGRPLLSFALLIYLRSRITAGQPDKLHAIARARFKAEPTWWTRIIWRISFVATRSAMPYGIMALSLVGLLPLVVVLAAIGSEYLLDLAGAEAAAPARRRRRDSGSSRRSRARKLPSRPDCDRRSRLRAGPPWPCAW